MIVLRTNVKIKNFTFKMPFVFEAFISDAPRCEFCHKTHISVSVITYGAMFSLKHHVKIKIKCLSQSSIYGNEFVKEKILIMLIIIIFKLLPPIISIDEFKIYTVLSHKPFNSY